MKRCLLFILLFADSHCTDTTTVYILCAWEK